MKYLVSPVVHWRRLLRLTTNQNGGGSGGRDDSSTSRGSIPTSYPKNQCHSVQKAGIASKCLYLFRFAALLLWKTALSPAIILYSVTFLSWHQSVVHMPLFRVVCLCWKCSRRPLRSLPLYTCATKIPKLPMAPKRPDPSFGMIHVFLVAAIDGSVVNMNRRSTPSGDVAKACSFT